MHEGRNEDVVIEQQLPHGWPTGVEATVLQVVKVDPLGAETTRYPGVVVPEAAHAPWICVRATWTHGTIAVDDLVFHPGDVLLEYFSPIHWYNVFAVFSPTHELRGWYANVTHPTRFDASTEPPTLAWHDLYLDVVSVPGGTVVLRDEDELDESGLAGANPELYAVIRAAAGDLAGLLAEQAFPFHGAAPGPLSTAEGHG